MESPRPLLRTRVLRVSRRDLAVTLLPLALGLVAATWAVLRFVRPAPPPVIAISTGPDGSTFQRAAERYAKLFERSGVKVRLLPSNGSLENLRRLADPKGDAEVGFVQVGVRLPDPAPGEARRELASLGTVARQPLYVLVRGTPPPDRLSALAGKRLVVGPEGSGTRVLALKLLKANEMDGPPTVLLELTGDEAAKQLVAGSVDAAFLMGDSATPAVMKSLRGLPDIQLASFRQADGYLRKFRFLSKLTLPEGAMDLAKDYPPRTLTLIGPTVELVARDDIHPALSDLLIRAAREIHGAPGMYRTAGEYPAPLARDFPISDDAERYYKSGEQFLYKRLPFWLASLVDRLLVIVLPLLVVIVPATRLAPALYRWRIRSRIYRFYGALMAIEREMRGGRTPEQQEMVRARLDDIARAVSELRTPPSFADQLYVLRDHVAAVRRRLDVAAAS
jgi:TRAP-type uncharacterized transport system substrate-binding protein